MRLFLILLTISPSFAQDLVKDIKQNNIFSATRLQRVKQENPHTEASHEVIPDPAIQQSYLITKAAEASGLKINSISLRKERVTENHATLVRIYFGYDSELENLVSFFETLEESTEGLIVENLNISARRKASKHAEDYMNKRASLNGNCIISFPKTEDDRQRLQDTEVTTQTNNVITKLLSGFTHALPGDAYLTSLILKEGSSLTIMGVADDHTEVGSRLSQANFLNDFQMGTAISTNSDRFIFKAKLNLDELQR